MYYDEVYSPFHTQMISVYATYDWSSVVMDNIIHVISNLFILKYFTLPTYMHKGCSITIVHNKMRDRLSVFLTKT